MVNVRKAVLLGSRADQEYSERRSCLDPRLLDLTGQPSASPDTCASAMRNPEPSWINSQGSAATMWRRCGPVFSGRRSPRQACCRRPGRIRAAQCPRIHCARASYALRPSCCAAAPRRRAFFPTLRGSAQPLRRARQPRPQPAIAGSARGTRPTPRPRSPPGAP